MRKLHLEPSNAWELLLRQTSRALMPRTQPQAFQTKIQENSGIIHGALEEEVPLSLLVLPWSQRVSTTTSDLGLQIAHKKDL